jgi:hypothetical protein
MKYRKLRIGWTMGWGTACKIANARVRPYATTPPLDSLLANSCQTSVMAFLCTPNGMDKLRHNDALLRTYLARPRSISSTSVSAPYTFRSASTIALECTLTARACLSV